MTIGLLLLTVFTFAYSMIAFRMERTIITAPLVFLGLGVVFSEFGVLPHTSAEPLLHIVAEAALIILLFLDAAKTNLSSLLMHQRWPIRMLLLGLPLTMVLGSLLAMPFLPGWPLVEVALVAAILAPTDAALGQAVVSNEAVPARVRETLTVESGLNDGFALPAVLLFASLSVPGAMESATGWVVFGLGQLVLGPLAGIAVGLAGGWAVKQAKARHLTSKSFEGVGAIALACSAYFAALAIGGNGFIAAFVAGLCFGSQVKDQCAFIFEFAENEGQILIWSAFFLLGLVLVPHAISALTLNGLAIILISLFVVRPLAIYLSLIGTDTQPVTRLFFGWFGPRGLATALFALLVVGKINPDMGEPVLTLAVNAVWISALLHGISALPGARLYGKIIKTKGLCPETGPGEEPTPTAADYAK